MRKGWLTLGLIIIFAGLILSYFYNVPVYEKSERIRDTGFLELSVSGNFAIGEHFFFNFSKGQFWTGTEEIFEPTRVEENYTIPPHKIVSFKISCPSGDLVFADVYMVEGVSPMMVVYINQSDDFTPLEDGNLTLRARMEGIINRNGTYTIEIMSVLPPIYKTSEETIQLKDDPPRDMTLGVIETVEKHPYFMLLPMGIVFASSGAMLGVWAVKSKKKGKSPVRRYKRR
jgi:hypothetical protein